MLNLDEIKRIVRPILIKHGIKKARIFGSLAHNKKKVNDIDLLVKIDQKINLWYFIGIQQQLEDELSMKVDLVEYDSLKPALKETILK